jgi:hypothetical protein
VFIILIGCCLFAWLLVITVVLLALYAWKILLVLALVLLTVRVLYRSRATVRR